LVQFLFGLAYPLLEGGNVFEFLFEVYRLPAFLIFHEKKYNLVNLITNHTSILTYAFVLEYNLNNELVLCPSIQNPVPERLHNSKLRHPPTIAKAKVFFQKQHNEIAQTVIIIFDITSIQARAIVIRIAKRVSVAKARVEDS
jgi:hypothetical protein